MTVATGGRDDQVHAFVGCPVDVDETVDVLVTAPGPVDTEFGARARMTYGFSATPEEVAEQSLRALGRKSYLAPTATNRFLQTSLAMLPRFGRVRVMEQIMAGMTGKAGA